MDATKRVLGIDPGSAICGWAVVESVNRQKFTLVDCDCIRTRPSMSTAERLYSLYLDLKAVIAKYRPQEMAVEELFFVQNVKTGIVVGQARGVILLSAAEAGLPVFEYKPNTIKLALTGYGHADKKQVQDMVKHILKLPGYIKQDDTADAVAVALTHIQSRQL